MIMQWLHEKIKLLQCNIFMLSVALFVGTVGCAGANKIALKQIAKGDTATIDFTCRLDDGSILTTTQKDIAFDEDENLSYAFVGPLEYGPVIIPVGAEVKMPEQPIIHPLMAEIGYQLSQNIDGLYYDKTQRVDLTTDEILGLPEGDRLVRFSRTMRRNKIIQVTKEQFVAKAGKEAKIGDIVFPENIIKWKVLDVKGNLIDVQLIAKDGGTVIMPYGPALIRDKGDHYDLEIDNRVGDLVRLGSYIGRIIDQDERLFTVDLSHPFGGRALACDIMAKPSEEKIDQDLRSATETKKQE